MTVEEFATAHDLPPRWVSLRRQCEAIIRDPQFWSRPDLKDAARALAQEASDLLDASRRAKLQQQGGGRPSAEIAGQRHDQITMRGPRENPTCDKR